MDEGQAASRIGRHTGRRRELDLLAKPLATASRANLGTRVVRGNR